MPPDRRIRAAIVDDEPLARDGLRMLLGGDPEVEVVAEAAGGKEAIAVLKRERPDLLFLDVQMPAPDGFGVLEALVGEAMPGAVVFVTAYDRYALKAFEVHAVDYLLKPFDDERFLDALRRAKQRLKQERAGELESRLLSLLEQQRGGGTRPARLAIREVGRVVFLPVEEIDWIESADYYVQLHVGAKSYLHRETMQSLEARLDPERFVRIHRKAIVNVQRVRELRSVGKRELVAVLSGGEELRVARSCRAKLERLR